MGLFDKIKDIMTDEEDDFDEYTEESAEFVKPPRRREREIEPPAYEREEKAERSSRHSKSDKVVNIHTTAQLQVVLVKPEGFEEAASIADNLNARRTVVLNLPFKALRIGVSSRFTFSLTILRVIPFL